MFEKFVGGSPANIAVGVTRYGLKPGFLGKVSNDQFGDFVVDYFNSQGIDTSHITRCKGGEKLGLTFTEMLSPSQSGILMYRNCIADLQLHVDDVDPWYIRSAKVLLVSGTALADSPSREAALKAVMLAKQFGTKVIFDIDYREYTWKNMDEISWKTCFIPVLATRRAPPSGMGTTRKSLSSNTGCRGLLPTPATGRSSASSPSLWRPGRASAEATAMAAASCTVSIRAGTLSTAWSSAPPRHP